MNAAPIDLGGVGNTAVYICGASMVSPPGSAAAAVAAPATSTPVALSVGPSVAVIASGDSVAVVASAPAGLWAGPGAAAASPGQQSFVAGAEVFASYGLMFSADGGVVHADPNAAGYVWAGVAAQSAPAGLPVAVVEAGAFAFSAWDWTPGAQIYVTAGGALSEAAPESGILHQIGQAITAAEILIAPQPQMQL